MGIRWEDGGYSAEVEIYVLADDRRFEVAEIGPESLILRSSEPAPSGHAQIVVRIDGREEIHDVILGTCDPASSEMQYV